MKAWKPCRAGLMPVLLLMLMACGSKSEPYGRIHDAAASGDGASIVLLVESGDSVLSGSSFSATWSYRPQHLAVWRLDRATGELTMTRSLPIPNQFNGARDTPTLQALSAEDARGQPVPTCDSALGACAVARAPQAFLTPDLSGGTYNGLKLIDGVSGVLVRMEQGQLVTDAWGLRDAEAVASAADRAMRDSLHRLFEIAVVQLERSLAADRSYPTERSPTYIDSAVSSGHEGLRAQYYIDVGGAIVAQVAEGNAQATQLRWRPSPMRKRNGMPQTFDCEGDSPLVTRWLPECHFAAAQEIMDPELTYVISRSAELKQSAARDPQFQQARRGVTFGVRHNDKAAGQVWLACVGLPASRVGGCDIEHADTPCAASLPLLCLKPDAHATPAGGQTRFEGRWLAARVAATAGVSGASLSTIAAADSRCARDFGPDWRLARWTDNGDSFVAEGSIDAVSRLWIDVPEHPAANCWTR